MSISLRTHSLAALFAGSLVVFTGVAGAAPIGEPRALIKTVPTITETIYWPGWGWGWGAPVAGGLIAGAIVGGALAAAPYGYYGPGYYPPPVAYGPPPGDAVGYCIQRFKSYDPSSGTYLGYDGNRHPCP